MDRSTQSEELDALKSIYYEEEFQVVEPHGDDDSFQAVFWAHLILPDVYPIKYSSSLQTEEISHLYVKYLPPIELQLTLPPDYPSKHPPNFKITSQWLPRSKTSLLCEKLDELWLENENSQIIFTWIDFLKSESLGFLKCENELDLTELYSKYLSIPDRAKCEDLRMKRNNRRHYSDLDARAILNLTFKVSPLKVLENYNIERDKIQFLRNCYTCNICFMDKLGKYCTKFHECNHVFCSDCIRAYFIVRIDEGSVQSIKCPEEKCTSEALPGQIKDLVPEALFLKYDKLLLNTALSSLTDIIYCPRSVCQYPVSWEPGDKMATCPHCKYAFCVFCKMVYHGIEPCRYRSEERQKLVDKYLSSSAEVRAQMELRFGKKQLESLVQNSLAESWIKDNSKKCPHCDAAIEKDHGCNKMICWRCNTYFCWLCSARLDQKDPYVHYKDPKSSCADKLFFLVPMDDEEANWEDWDWVDVSDESDFSDMEFEDPNSDAERD